MTDPGTIPAKACERAARVLIIDDERLICWSVQQHLEKAGYEIKTAPSGEDGLAVIGAWEPDVLLLDVRLPGIDGTTVLKKVREEKPDMGVVMLSAHATVDVAVEAMKLGAADFVTKPFDLGLLERAVARLWENLRLRRLIAGFEVTRRASSSEHRMVGETPAMRSLKEMVRLVGRSSSSTALIHGESGTGKAVVAQAIHEASDRCAAHFLTINCTSLPQHLVESELFGYERGAFTDAKTQKKGLFELANGGTVLLDEIGDMPLASQAKLLQVMETKTFKRVGGTSDVMVGVRLLAATNRDLSQLVRDGQFRQDLYYRLNIVTLHVPPLRDRAADIPLLVAHFVGTFNESFRRQVQGATPRAIEAMCRYAWPGNVRELRNTVERAFILEATDWIDLQHLPADIVGTGSSRPAVAVGRAATAESSLDLDQAEEQLIREALAKADGNQTRAAKLLGISRDTLRYRMRKRGIGSPGE